MALSDIQPVQIDSSVVAKEERVPLFYIDDDEFTIPKKIKPNVAMRYLTDVRDRGPEVALAEVMTEILGEDAMDALAESEAVTDEQMQQIMGIVQKLLLGAMDRTSGKSRAERRR